MVTKDGFPLFLVQHADEAEQPDIGKARDRAVISSRTLKTSILGVVAAAIVFAILMGNPLALFPKATAFLVATPAPQDGIDKSTPIIQSAIQPAAGPQALPPAASETPSRDETASAVETADQKQTEIPQPTALPLLDQFQVWATEQDARLTVAAVEPVQEVQPAQDALPAQDAGPQIAPAQRHRHAHRVQNAQREIRTEQNPRAKVRRKQNAHLQVRPAQDARAQDRPAQNASPSLLRRIGLVD